jgi:hypothetical protein
MWKGKCAKWRTEREENAFFVSLSLYLFSFHLITEEIDGLSNQEDWFHARQLAPRDDWRLVPPQWHLTQWDGSQQTRPKKNVRPVNDDVR